MQIQLKNKKYEHVIEDKCAAADRLIAKMLRFGYLKHQIMRDATNKATIVCENFGTLNITKQQAKALRKIADEKVKELIMKDVKEGVDVEFMFSVK